MTKGWKRGTVAGLVASGLFVFLGASNCSATEYLKDSGVSGRNTAPAEIGNMPDGFNNWAAKCDGPNMVYVIYHGSQNRGALAVVANDPRCTGKP